MAGLWTVISQTQREELNPQGSFVQVVEVSFELVSGTRGTVTVPARLYTEEYVRQVVDAKAQTMNAVGNLSG